MRVLIVNNFAHVTGGADLHCLELTEGLRERGHEVQWLATESPKNVEKRGRFVPLTVTTENRDRLPLVKRLDVSRRALWNPAAGGAMRDLAETFQPDVVHIHKAYVQLSVAPIVVASHWGFPLVQTVHDYEFISASPFDSRGKRWDHHETKLTFQALNSFTFPVRRRVHRPRIKRWIAVSRVVADRYRSVGEISCEVIPNFSGTSAAENRGQADRDGVTFLGRLTPEKGVEDLLDAAKLLPNVRFRIVGDGPLKEVVRRAAREFENVEYVGFVSKNEGGKLIGSSLACLMPSIWEDPGPLTSLEAMAEGTPVICYPMGGVAEYVADAGAGLVCSEANPESLVRSIRRLIEEPTLWEECSNCGKEAIAGRHSRSSYLDALEATYGSLVDI